MQIDTMTELTTSEIDPELFQIYINMYSDKSFVRNLEREPSDLKREFGKLLKDAYAHTGQAYNDRVLQCLSQDQREVMISLEISLQNGTMDTISELEALFEQQEQAILSNIANLN